MDANYFTPKSAGKFCCEYCDFTCCKTSDMKRHKLTLKHENAKNANSNANFGVAEKVENSFTCDFCEKKFKHASSLSRHKKKCESIKKSYETEEPQENSLIQYTNEHDLVLHLLNQNKQLQEQIIEMCKDKNHITNNNNQMINSNNKTFNLQVFLNETCKDAMNLTDFVNSLQIQISDLEKVGKDGFVNGISNIILKNLKDLDVTMRPVHCSDQKREVMYVKNDNQWHNDSKESPENQMLKKAIKQVVHKNICMIPEWKKLYPDCIYADSRKSDIYNHIVYEAMDNNDTNTEKIIKKIAKEVVISK
jgi:hypothetical protein